MQNQSSTVVALFDLLGFSNRVMNNGLPGILVAYNSLIDIVKKHQAGAMLNCGIPVGDGGCAAAFGIFDINHAYFSDTIVLWCSYNTFCFPPFCHICNVFICEVLESGMPLRGGVAVGEAHMDRPSGTYIGKALVEAAEVEKSQDWIGVSFGPSFAAAPYNEFFMAESVLVYRRHRKSGRAQWVPGLVLDWPRVWRNTRVVPVQRLLANLNSDPQFSKYYRHAIEFADFSDKNKDWSDGGHLHTS